MLFCLWCKRNKHIRKYVSGDYIVLSKTNCFLNFGIIYYISQNKRKAAVLYIVRFLILFHGRNRARIEIRSDCVLRSELQCRYRKYSASGTDVEYFTIFFYILFKLPQTKLRCLMHTCSECRTRIDMKYYLILCVIRNFFPRRHNHKIIYAECVEIFLPVIYPILVLGLRSCNNSLAYITKGSQCLNLLFDALKNHLVILIRLKIKMYICRIAYCRFGRYVDKHPL